MATKEKAKPKSLMDAVNAYVKPIRKTWFDELPEVQQQELLAVRAAWRAGKTKAKAAVQVHRAYVDHTGSDVKFGTFVRWLKSEV